MSERLQLAGPRALVALAAALAVGLALGWLARGGSAPVPTGPGAADVPAGTVWTCSMHPQIRMPQPGQCPICGMDLIPLVSGQAEPGSRVLELSPEAAALAEVDVVPAERRAVRREVRLVGKVDFDETRLKFITARIAGRLERLYVDTTGTPVQEGHHLVEIYSPELLSAQAELIQSLQAERALGEGSSPLLRETARATVRSVREKLRLWGLEPAQIEEIARTGQASDRVTLYAPMGGVVVQKSKNVGEYVKVGERIYTIADLSQLWVRLEVYEQDLPWIRRGQEVELRAEAFPGEVFLGRVVLIDPVLDPRTRTVKVRVNVSNLDGRLKPEMFVRAVVWAPLDQAGRALDASLVGKWTCPMHPDEVRDGPGSCSQCGMDLVRADELYPSAVPGAELPLVVPASAVLWTGVRSLVYVRLPGEDPRFEGRVVELGPRAGDWWVVTSGLAPGEAVVRSGAFKLDSALQIEGRPSMMLPPPEAQAPAERLEIPAAFRGGLAPLFAAYLDWQEALAGDALPAAQGAAERLGRAVAATAGDLPSEAAAVWDQAAARLTRAAGEGAAASDLAAARVAFGAASRALLALDDRLGHPGDELREVFCPMAEGGAGAPWLQRGEEVTNPYFGAGMLRCGELRRTRPGSESPAAGGPGSRPETGPRPESSPAPDPAPGPEPGSGPEPAPVPSEGAALQGLLEAYLPLQAALAGDDLDGARAAAATLLERAESWQRGHDDELAAALLSGSRGAAQAADLAGLRKAFSAASLSLEALLRARPEAPRPRRFTCPMAFGGKGASWLQAEPGTRNPYFGARMLRCGTDHGPLGGEEGPR